MYSQAMVSASRVRVMLFVIGEVENDHSGKHRDIEYIPIYFLWNGSQPMVRLKPTKG